MFTPLTPGMCTFISELELTILTVAGTWHVAQDRKGMQSVQLLTEYMLRYIESQI